MQAGSGGVYCKICERILNASVKETCCGELVPQQVFLCLLHRDSSAQMAEGSFFVWVELKKHLQYFFPTDKNSWAITECGHENGVFHKEHLIYCFVLFLFFCSILTVLSHLSGGNCGGQRPLERS